MYNGIMKLRQIKKILKKLPFSYRTIIIFGSLLILGIIIVLLFNTKRPTSQDKLVQLQGGISFDTFWTKLQEGSAEFLQGSTLYIADIESINVANFNKVKGHAALWQATIVRCEQFMSTEEGNDGNLNCLGQSARAMIADPQTTGISDILSIEPNEAPFAGRVVKASDIKIGVDQAEQIANQTRHYKYQNTDDFYYKLNIDPLTVIPSWQISRFCSLSSKQDSSCDSASEWSIKVNASNGELL